MPLRSRHDPEKVTDNSDGSDKKNTFNGNEQAEGLNKKPGGLSERKSLRLMHTDDEDLDVQRAPGSDDLRSPKSF